MATPEQRRAEAASASSTFHVAMAMLGARAFAETMELWDDVVPTGTRVAATAAKFTAAALKLVRFRRHQVQAIVIPYIRLVRALHTGYTTWPVFAPEPSPVSLNKLRDDFTQAVADFAPDALEDGLVEDHYTEDDVDDSAEIKEPDGSTYRPYVRSRWRDELEVTAEKIDAAPSEQVPDVEVGTPAPDPDPDRDADTDSLGELLDEIEAAAEAEAELVLDAVGRGLLESRLQQIEEYLKSDDFEGLSAQVVDQLREDAHGVVGRRVAAHAERLVQNGGRHAEEAVARRDRRVIGYARVHHPKGDFHPCSFCAMLISRGVVYKKTSAEKRDTFDNKTWKVWRKGFDVPGAEFDKYHPLCHCRGEAIYSDEQYDEDPRFQANRDLDRLWQSDIAKRGYRGKAAEAEWRALLKTLDMASQEQAEKEHSRA